MNRQSNKPPLRIFTTTLWEYPSQHYLSPRSAGGTGFAEQGDRDYVGATPSWVIWQLLQRFTRDKDLIVDPMCGSGTTIDVARDLGRRALGYDLAPPSERKDIFRADARRLPLENEVADFVFVDPPYSKHINYSDDPACIGKLDAGEPGAKSGTGGNGGNAYYQAMDQVFAEVHRILKPQRYMAVYVSDSWRKHNSGQATASGSSGASGGARGPDRQSIGDGGPLFMPIGFELFSLLRRRFKPIDIIAVVRHNAKLRKGNWHKAAEEGNFFLRGFNYLLIMKKVRQTAK